MSPSPVDTKDSPPGGEPADTSTEPGALSDANYQTTKLSKISASVLSLAQRRGTLPVSSRLMLKETSSRRLVASEGRKILVCRSLVNREWRGFSKMFLNNLYSHGSPVFARFKHPCKESKRREVRFKDTFHPRRFVFCSATPLAEACCNPRVTSSLSLRQELSDRIQTKSSLNQKRK